MDTPHDGLLTAQGRSIARTKQDAKRQKSPLGQITLPHGSVKWRDYVAYLSACEELTFKSDINIYSNKELLGQSPGNHILFGNKSSYIRQTAVRDLVSTAINNSHIRPLYIDYECFQKGGTPNPAHFFQIKEQNETRQKLTNEIAHLARPWRTLFDAPKATNNPILTGRYHHFFANDNEWKNPRFSTTPAHIVFYNPRKKVALGLGKPLPQGQQALIADSNTTDITQLGSRKHWGLFSNLGDTPRQILQNVDTITEQKLVRVKNLDDYAYLVMRRTVTLDASCKALLSDQDVPMRDIMNTLKELQAPWQEAAQEIVDHPKAQATMTKEMKTAFINKIDIMCPPKTMVMSDGPSFE